ncbi:tautomerase family protein [Alkanindiges illinoisensis]|uniref:Tautomerase family protein n=1 Tax=Alkanindiges illinoisensis TaxID=197183 RepID=A0A4Y7XBZ2_9GAMM|nr:tautomerase family protein [Alkanindiges illinoisensis]TEU25043.1 tautomerase family protein [Alkanindiges illinoisensis]
MAQIKIYALANTITQHRQALSTAIHTALVSALNYPVEKKFQRFIALAPEDFIFPADRSSNYTILEISMFEGRSTASKKAFIQQLFTNIEQQCGIASQDIEITITETPRHHWGIRGQCGDELSLNYKVDV